MGLEWNGDKIKELTAHGVGRCLASGDALSSMERVDRYLFGARPSDYGAWCLEKAVEADDERAATFYLGEVLTCIVDPWTAGGLTVDNVRKNAWRKNIAFGFVRSGDPTKRCWHAPNRDYWATRI